MEGEEPEVAAAAVADVVAAAVVVVVAQRAADVRDAKRPQAEVAENDDASAC